MKSRLAPLSSFSSANGPYASASGRPEHAADVAGRRPAVLDVDDGVVQLDAHRASSVKVHVRGSAPRFRKTAGVTTAPIRARSADIIDVFVYVVVLNLAVEYVPSVISEGFTLSLLTAVLLKVALEVVMLPQGPDPHAGSRAADTPARPRLADRDARCGWSRPVASSSSSSWSTSSSATR